MTKNIVSLVLMLFSFSYFVSPKFIRFKGNFEYFYSLKTDINFRDVGNFQINAKISYTVVENTPEYQEMLLRVYSFHFKRTEDTDPVSNNMDLSKWFSFQIKPNGQILRVYHPHEDDEVLATKKGLAALLSAKLHDKDELSSGVVHIGSGQWKYQTEEVGNEGVHSARYMVKETGIETEFKKINDGHNTKNSKGYFEKTLLYHKELGIVHKVLIEDSFTALTESQEFDPYKNMRKVKPVNQFSDRTKFPEMTVLSKGELHFLTREPVGNALIRPLENVLTSSIHVDKYQRKKPKVDVQEKKREINDSINCIRNEPAEGSPMVNTCFLKILEILKILPDKVLKEVAEYYFLRLNLKLNENRQSTVIMLDAYGTLESNLSQEIISRMIFQRPNPDPELIVQYMVHIVSSDGPPNPVILEAMEDIIFHQEKYPASFYTGSLYDRVMLALGAAARKLYRSGETEKAKGITHRINNLLGIHDPWMYRRKRSTQSELEQEQYDIKHVILLETLGNAAIDHSYEYIISHINATNSPWIKRAGVHALRNYESEMAAQAILKAAIYDDNEEVRYEAKLMYQAHPKSEYKHYNSCSVIKVADNESVVSDDQSFGPHNRQKRGFFEGLQFRLEAPSIDWRKLLGSTSLGGSFGFIMSNFLALKIAPLSGYLKVTVHDEAYARLHLGVVNYNLDIILARICFKGETSYNINILQVIQYIPVICIAYLSDEIMQ